MVEFFSTLTETEWKLLEVAGSWLSGIGALLAVVVSLHIARQSGAIKVSLYAGHRIVMEQGNQRRDEIIAVNATNIGERTIIISTFGWEARLIKRKYWFQLPGGYPGSSNLPARIDPGEAARCLIPYAAFIENADEFLEGVPKWILPIYMRTFKATVVTTHGVVIRRPIEKALRDKIIARARRNR